MTPPDTETFDAIVVGGSLAGCTAAMLLGRRGLKVVVLEKESSPTAYKKICTHFIQPSATPTLQRLGLTEKIEAAGGVRNSTDMYSRYGWVDHCIEEYGYSVRREVLDPIVRNAAAETPGVDLRTGHTVTGLLNENGRFTGVTVEAKDQPPQTLRAKLVIAADGRYSRVGQLANVPAVQTPNNRFMYWAYYRGLKMPRGQTRSLYWMLDPDAAYVYPNENGITLVAAQPHKDKIPEWKADLEGSFMRYFDAVPGAPNLREGERVGEIRGMLDMPNHTRELTRPGLAFIGDAGLTSDPLFGVGCGWAFQSGEWLADTLAEPLRNNRGIDEALTAYKALHEKKIALHHKIVCMGSTGEKFHPIEKLLLKAAVKDRKYAHDFSLFTTRQTHPEDLFGIGFLIRAAWLSFKPGRAWGETAHSSHAEAR